MRGMGPVKARRRGFTGGQVLTGMAAAQLAGEDFLVGLDRVRADAAGQQVTPVPGLATSTATGLRMMVYGPVRTSRIAYKRQPAGDRLGGHLPVLEQGQLPDRLVVVLQRGQLVGPGDLALAVPAQGDGLQDRQVSGGLRGGAPPGQPVVPGRVHLGEGGGERGPPVEHDQRPAGLAGLGIRWQHVGQRRQRGRQCGAQRRGCGWW